MWIIICNSEYRLICVMAPFYCKNIYIFSTFSYNHTKKCDTAICNNKFLIWHPRFLLEAFLHGEEMAGRKTGCGTFSLMTLTSFTGTVTDATLRLQTREKQLHKVYNYYSTSITIQNIINGITMQCKLLKFHLIITIQVKFCIITQ